MENFEVNDCNNIHIKGAINLSDGSSSDSETSFQSMQGMISKQSLNLNSALQNENYRNTKNDRFPTRRPDPNVHNRNALLARENRRKKKIHLETMEKELDKIRSVNHNLLKALKKQMKKIKGLEREKSYYKSILGNQTEIKNLLTLLNSRLPSPSNNSKTESQIFSVRSSCSGFDQETTYFADTMENMLIL